MHGFVIAIDGPVASGKGTIAPLLAKRLKAFYMNTGALFRMLALLCKRMSIDPLSEEMIVAFLSENELNLEDNKALLNGEDVTDDIYHADISLMSSVIAGNAKIHAKVIALEQKIAQAKIGQGRIVIVEGRNIGTAVFPDAELKVFLTASLEERAKRRFHQSTLRGEQASYTSVLSDTEMRDARDREREFFPMVSDPENYGYTILDNTGLSEEDTLDHLLSLLKKKELL